MNSIDLENGSQLVRVDVAADGLSLAVASSNKQLCVYPLVNKLLPEWNIACTFDQVRSSKGVEWQDLIVPVPGHDGALSDDDMAPVVRSFYCRSERVLRASSKTSRRIEGASMFVVMNLAHFLV